MVSRRKLSIYKPKKPYIGLIQSQNNHDAEQRKVSDDLQIPHWKQAMEQNWRPSKETTLELSSLISP